ncbi:MAG: cupin domain-containing protein [Pseudomonadota bacterium]
MRKTSPKAPVRIAAADGAFDGGPWSGAISGDALNTDALILFVAEDAVGAGPSWHLHPYDEIFILKRGRARFTVGDQVIDAEEGDVVMGPANVPHKYENLGPGRMESIDIHLSRVWRQTDLDDPAEG